MAKSASQGRSLLLLSCSNHKESGGVRGARDGRSLPEILSPAVRSRLLEGRNKIRRMLGGGPPRLYNEDQRGGYRDSRLSNRQLANGRDFGGSEAAAYLPAYTRYAGRFSGQLESMAPNFWRDLPPSIEVIFVSGLYGLVLWDEPIQDYDCHFADHTEDRQLKVKDLWGDTLSDTLMEFLRVQPRSAPIKTVYDLLSESLYQSLFKWERIQNAAVYHRIFQGVSGPDILDPLTRVLATKISGFTNGTYGKGWQPRGDEDQVEFGFESKVGEDALATREGDFERVRKHLLKQKPWLKSLPKHICETLILGELSWSKVKDLAVFDWGIVAVSLIKPVERFLADTLGLIGKETLGTVVERARSDSALQPRYKDLEQLNNFFRRGKHIVPPPIDYSDIPTVRREVFEILEFACQLSRRVR